jgi:hypothetical protein
MLAFLVARVLATDADWSLFAGHAGPSVVGEKTIGQQLQAGFGSKNNHSCLDEIELRRIIREELAAHPTAIAASQTAEKSGVAVEPLREPDSKRQLETVNRQLDNFIGAGAISESEMEALQGDIATLDSAGRKEILGKLVRAMNSGSLKGHF